MIGRKTTALLCATTGLAGFAGGIYAERHRSEVVFESTATATTVAGASPELPTLTIPGAVGAVATTIAAPTELPPVPPAVYRSGIRCTGPMIKNIYIDQAHSHIVNSLGVDTLSVIISLYNARGQHEIIRNSFNETTGTGLAYDLAELNNIDTSSPAFDPNNFRGLEGVYWMPSDCVNPADPNHPNDIIF